MRILSNIIIVVFLIIAIPSSIQALWGMKNMFTQILMIPRALVFSPYVILFIIAVLRYTYRIIEDIKALRDKTYVQRYNTEEREMLI